MLFSIETHITCDFPRRGGPDPLSLRIRAWSGSNLFDILTIYLKDFFLKKVILRKSADDKKT